jgi:hypothetical protein
MVGPPSGPAAQRVSTTRHGVTGKYCNSSPIETLNGAENSRELFQYTFTFHAPGVGAGEPAKLMLSQKHWLPSPGDVEADVWYIIPTVPAKRR